jgi:hypothetical protein
MSRKKVDPDFLQAALVGYELEKAKIDAQIEELRKKLKNATRSPKHAQRGEEPGEPATRVVNVPATSRRRMVAYKKAAVRQKKKTGGTRSGGPGIEMEAEE